MNAIKITKAANDPVCNRVSVGGKPSLGYYGVYRGKLPDCIVAMKAVLAAMEKLECEPTPSRHIPPLGGNQRN